MYHYEQILNEHRQRVARGVQNYERRRVAAERATESSVGEQDSGKNAVEERAVLDDCELESETYVGEMSSRR